MKHRITIILVISFVLFIGFQNHAQTVSATYSTGDIATVYDNSIPYTIDNSCNGTSTSLGIVLPAGGPWEVTSVDIDYQMEARNGAYKSEQRSIVYCQNTTTFENGGTWYSGSSTGGIQSYSRTNISIANGIYSGGTLLNFDMLAARTWGTSVESGCGTYYNYVQNNTWTITVHYQSPPTCPDPSTLNAINIGSDQAELTWQENGTASLWDLELVLDGFAPTSTPTQSGVTSTNFVYAGLTPSTTYNYYVRSNCGGGDYSNWIGPFNFSTTIVTGQVYVTATIGLGSAIYPTVKQAFDNINNGVHQGDIVITIGANDGETITETAEAVLNSSGTGSSNYTSVYIKPGGAAIQVVGSLGGSCCVPTGIIRLNKAQNVIIDGRQNLTSTTRDLTIENTNVGSYSSALVIMAASNNIVKYTTIKSAVTGTCCGAGTLSITDNNTSGGFGSSDNIVEHCFITSSSTGKQRRAIYGKGANTRENFRNILRFNTITNFSEYGIFLGNSTSSEGYNRSWIIDGNELYQNDAITAMNSNQIAICIGNPFSASYGEQGTFVVKNNSIGSNGVGGYWSTTGVSSSYRVAAISMNTITSAYSYVDGNKVYKFDVKATSTATDYGVFSGIVVSNGKTAIGSIEGNTIGDLNDLQNIQISRNNSTNGGFVSGIHVRSSFDVQTKINNNTIAGFDITQGNSSFYQFYGVRNSCATTYPQDSVFQNNISYHSLTRANYFYGIFGNGYVAKNRVRDIAFTGAVASSTLTGISWWGGELTGSDSRGVENNEIILGLTKTGNSTAQNDDIIGINVTRGDAEIYHNSVLIQGTHLGSENTVAIFQNWSGTIDFRHNAMYNERTGGSGKHFGFQRSNSGVAFNSSNNAFVLGTASNNITANIGGTDRLTLLDFQSSTGDVNSIAETNVNQPVASLFPLYALDSLDVTVDSWLKAGIPSIITDDIAFRPRDPSIPTIGAYEPNINIPLPTQLLNFYGIKNGPFNELYWSTATEINSDYFELQRSRDALNWSTLEIVNAAGESTSLIQYHETDAEPYTLTYYRLIQYDLNGDHYPSNIVAIDRLKDGELVETIFPNPTLGQLFIQLTPEHNEKSAELQLVNELGQTVYSESILLVKGQLISLNLESISKGTYYLKINTEQRLLMYPVIKAQ